MLSSVGGGIDDRGMELLTGNANDTDGAGYIPTKDDVKTPKSFPCRTLCSDKRNEKGKGRLGTKTSVHIIMKRQSMRINLIRT